MNKQNQETSNIDDAITAIKDGRLRRKPAKFNETVAVAFNLTLPRDSSIKGFTKAPAGISRNLKIATFSSEDQTSADYSVKESDMKSFFEDKMYKKCDICISEKKVFPSLSKVGAKKLGPRKLMPDARFGTLTEDIPSAISNFREGVITMRSMKNKTNQRKSSKTDNVIIHAVIGKISQSVEDLRKNFDAAVLLLQNISPAKARTKSIFLSSTMGKSISVTIERGKSS